jgi:NitT/TauT family transport system permease protein
MALKNTIGFVSVAFFLSLWTFITYYWLVSAFFFPSITTLLHEAKEMFVSDLYYLDIFYSLFRVLVSFMLACFFSVIVWAVLYSYKRIYDFTLPFITFVRYVPVEWLFPLLILFLWMWEAPKIWLLFIGIFFPLLILIIKELNNIPHELRDLCHVLWFSRTKKLSTYFYSILPLLYENSRIMIWLCWWYIVVAEMIATENGIGFTIRQAQKYANIPKIYIALITLWIIGIIVDSTFQYLRFYFFPYLKHEK